MNRFLKPSTAMLLGIATVAPLCGLSLTSRTTPLRYVALSAAHAQDAAPVAPAEAPVAPAEAPAEKTPEQLSEAAYVVLEKTCSNCHGEGKRLNKAVATDRASYAKLLNDQKMVVAGKPDESPLYTRMIDHENPMPPKKAEPKPTAEEIEAVRLWIEKGAPAPAPVATEAKPAE